MKRALSTIFMASLAILVLAWVGCEESNDGAFPGLGNGATKDSLDTEDTETVEDEIEVNTNDDTDNTDENNGVDTNTFEEETTDDDTDICDAQDFEISMVPTRLMILQDMSGSMTSGEGAWGGGKSKWILAREAMTQMLTNPANAAIEFGFDTFPNDDLTTENDCSVKSPVVHDASSNSASAIVSAMNSLEPFGMTPLCSALVNFNTSVIPNYAPNFQAPGAQQFLLVVSDGEDTCGGENGCGDNSYSSAINMRNRTADLLNLGVRTFVIGFGAALGSSAQLNYIAAAGGTSYKKSINVKNQAELQAALDNIAATVASCTFDIDQPDESADPDKVNFIIDGITIGRDDTCTQDGWRWVDPEHTQVEFCGGVCSDIKSGKFSSIQATFGCPTEIVVPVK